MIKQTLSILSSVIILLFNSCNKDSEKPNNETTELPSIENIAQDTEFIEYVDLLYSTDKTILLTDNENYIAELNTKYPDLNEEEQLDFANALGFESYLEFHQHLLDILILEQKLQDKYTLSEQNSDELNALIEKAFFEKTLTNLENGHIFVTDTKTNLEQKSLQLNDDLISVCYDTERKLMSQADGQSCYDEFTDCLFGTSRSAQERMKDIVTNECIEPYLNELDQDVIDDFANNCELKERVDEYFSGRICSFNWTCCVYSHCAVDPGSLNDTPSNYYDEHCMEPLLGKNLNKS